MIARRDDDRTAALDLAARRDGPAAEMEGRFGVGGGHRELPVASVAAVGSVVLAAFVVVKWRSSRRRSSAPLFQIAYSSESPSATAEAAMMFVSEPIVDHSRVPSAESMMTRVRAAVAASP